MTEPQPSGGEDAGGFSCIFIDCDKTNNSSCISTCIFSGHFFSPPPPPPPLAGKSTQSHLAPFLIATVCILGISFLLLTTCTIILRYRFSRRRRNSPAISDESPADDGGFSVVDHPIWLINTVGLQQSVIDSITAFKYSKLDGILIDGSDCSVCLTEFEDGDDLRLLPKCSHAFHLNCIDTWLRSHKNCPLCRAPVVNNDASAGNNFSSNRLGSSNLSTREEDHVVDSFENNERGLVLSGVGEECSHDVLVDLPIEGVKLAQILKKNRELRILSDLGENHRFRSEKDGDDRIRRSISFNSSASLALHRAMDNVCFLGSEGSSSDNHVLVEDKKIDFDHNKETKRGSSMSGLSMKNSSIGRSLQKGSVSMKRSFSSSSKLFSFRRTKSQASILPL